MTYIPKDATQQDIFITKYPSYDGRGIKIAIIDSGIDLSLEGLQKTSEGLPKIIDCFDFTGAGDVDTSVIKEMDSENILIGLSGRKLKIPTKWKNPTGKWHLGIKSFYKPKSIEELKSDKNKIEKLPEIDCIVWNDGQKWLACIETFGDLENAKILTSFRDSFEYGILINEVEIVYCITVHDDGNLLEIFTPYFGYGSAVAQVAAAYFPQNIENNGLAPGAQIISMCVMDPEINLANMVAVKKALLKCIERKVDIINYSINGFTIDPDIVQLIHEMVKKHNILIIKGSGNFGPFHASLNKYDVFIQDVIFKIGALLTPETKKNVYKIDVNDTALPVIHFYSSRGPAKDGSQGVDFVAPATVIIKDNPRFDIEKNRTYEGTSYASPNAAGVVACLLSALKANSIQYSPFSIKFALFKTAKLPENGNKLEFGNGIIQIDDAFEYCRKNGMDKISTDLWALKGTKNIYYIVTDENQIVKEYNLDLPSFAVIDEKAKWILQLSSHAKKYIEISEVDSNHSFSVKIDTCKLEPGNLYFSEIEVLHPFNPSVGPVFNIPVTVTVPIKGKENNNYFVEKHIALYDENPYHIFVHQNTRECEIKITAIEETKAHLCFYCSAEYAKIEEYPKIFKFSPKSRIQTYSIILKTEKIYEICIFQLIGSPSFGKCKIEFNFRD